MSRFWSRKNQKIFHRKDAEKSTRTPLWQGILLSLGSLLVFLLLIEGGLALFGIKPMIIAEDPFVGFSSNVPLYVSDTNSASGRQMVTAQNKLRYFNKQNFTSQKSRDTYRIFTLGGSTTYGRPYDDLTSFSGWLRELLPLADGSKHWEVINAGGISYASYRVAQLMEELVNYQPDLFIVYTGHNEFLEERTYSKIKEMPTSIRFAVGLLSRTRTWSAMTGVMQKLGVAAQIDKAERDKLSSEVDAILDKSAGLDRYTRDDVLQGKILQHYRISLERIASIAATAGARVLFVTPASNLKDCSPFKSEHTAGLDTKSQEIVDQLLSQARSAIKRERWQDALNLLDEAVKIAPRYAEIPYLRGQTLLSLKRYVEAEEAFLRARDEDVCPLRALTPMRQIVTQVASESKALLVDYTGFLEHRMQQSAGYAIPGQEFFLDHVHPTIEGHGLLAVELVKTMITAGVVSPESNWEPRAVSAAREKIEAKIDKGAHAQALTNLARVLLWAGKKEDAARLAFQASQIPNASEQVQVSSASLLSSLLLDKGERPQAMELLYSTLDKLPGAIEIRLKLGQLLSDPNLHEPEKAIAHLLLVCQQLPEHDSALSSFSLLMAQRGRLDIAFDSASRALQINPKNAKAQIILQRIHEILKDKKIEPMPFQIDLEIYPSKAPRRLIQLRRIAGSQMIPHGVEVEFYESGRLKSYKDLDGGKISGEVKSWDKNGNLL